MAIEYCPWGKADNYWPKEGAIMPNVCINCGRKIGTFSMESPFELCNGQVLCAKCAGAVRHKIGNLYGSKSEGEFKASKNEILSKCKLSYTDLTVDAIEQKIDEIYRNDVRPQIERTRNCSIDIEEQDTLKRLAESQLLTTGYDFSGYKIIKYIGVISGEVVLGTGFLSEFSASFSDLFGAESSAFADKLETAKDAAIKKLTLKSAEKGGNAIIGIDFDYLTFASNMVGVVVNGTSVMIEKIENITE